MCVTSPTTGVEIVDLPVEHQRFAGDCTPMPPGTMSRHSSGITVFSSSNERRQPRSTEEDFARLSSAVDTLHTSGWYHGAMTYTEAKRKLRGCDIGTFLVRDSSDPNYLFTMSVKTPRGTTSVRIEYEYGKFTFDSEEAFRKLAPSFNCVVKLLHHYIKMSGSKDNAKSNSKHRPIGTGNSSNNNSGQLVWLEPSGRRDIVARITTPLASKALSLQHLCRVSLNRYVEPRLQAELPLPGKLKAYLKEYPFDQ